MKIKGGGARKIGRGKEKCAKYRLENRKGKNKIKKYKKMLRKLQDNSDVAIDLKNKIKELEDKIKWILKKR